MVKLGIVAREVKVDIVANAEVVVVVVVAPLLATVDITGDEKGDNENEGIFSSPCGWKLFWNGNKENLTNRNEKRSSILAHKLRLEG